MPAVRPANRAVPPIYRIPEYRYISTYTNSVSALSSIPVPVTRVSLQIRFLQKKSVKCKYFMKKTAKCVV
jgi:hypothetical protein